MISIIAVDPPGADLDNRLLDLYSVQDVWSSLTNNLVVLMRLSLVSSARRQVRLGKRLAADKETCIHNGSNWKKYVKDEYGISRERADELIRIGIGIISVEKSRESKRKSQQKTRLKHRSRSYASSILIHHDELCKLFDKFNRRINLLDLNKEDISALKKDLKDVEAAIKILKSAASKFSRGIRNLRI